jgi:hypothetical protein
MSVAIDGDTDAATDKEGFDAEYAPGTGSDDPTERANDDDPVCRVYSFYPSDN